MSEQEQSINESVNHLFRHEYGKLVAVLTKTFGINNIELAEDVVQDAMLTAIQDWTYKGIPKNPIGWIYTVAKNKALNIAKQETHRKSLNSKVVDFLNSEETSQTTIDLIFTEQEISDDQLRMMFTCCHPSISQDSQVALTLKTLCGFSIPEIAKAFLASDDNINKRLVRARKTIRKHAVQFEIPSGKELKERLNSVLETIYLLFNEGYDASEGDQLIRYDLCEEAIRLCELLAKNIIVSQSSQVYALLALMYLNTSRFKARTNTSGIPVDLEHQNRTLWDRSYIQKGLINLQYATQKKELSIYHILATISAHHATAKDFNATNWKEILKLYDHLKTINSSPLILLNRAIVLAKTENPKSAILAIDAITDQSTLINYLPYFFTKAELHFLNKEPAKAIDFLTKTKKFDLNIQQKTLIEAKIKAYSKKD